MPITVQVKVEGLAELGARMRKLSEDIRGPVARAAVGAGAKVIRDQARANAPYLTGALKEAIGSRRSKRGSNPTYEEWLVGVFKVSGNITKNSPTNRRLRKAGLPEMYIPPEIYWRFLEFGTVHISPGKFSFLRPAFDQEKGFAVQAMKEKLKQRIEKAEGMLI